MTAAVSVDLSSPWAFAAVIALALVDGIVPLVPARTSIIALGVVAGAGDSRAYPRLILATVAAFVSDNTSPTGWAPTTGDASAASSSSEGGLNERGLGWRANFAATG